MDGWMDGSVHFWRCIVGMHHSWSRGRERLRWMGRGGRWVDDDDEEGVYIIQLMPVFKDQ